MLSILFTWCQLHYLFSTTSRGYNSPCDLCSKKWENRQNKWKAGERIKKKWWQRALAIETRLVSKRWRYGIRKMFVYFGCLLYSYACIAVCFRFIRSFYRCACVQVHVCSYKQNSRLHFIVFLYWAHWLVSIPTTFIRKSLCQNEILTYSLRGLKGTWPWNKAKRIIQLHWLFDYSMTVSCTVCMKCVQHVWRYAFQSNKKNAGWHTRTPSETVTETAMNAVESELIRKDECVCGGECVRWWWWYFRLPFIAFLPNVAYMF